MAAKNTIILLDAPLSFFCPMFGYAVVDFCNDLPWNNTGRALEPFGIPESATKNRVTNQLSTLTNIYPQMSGVPQEKPKVRFQWL